MARFPIFALLVIGTLPAEAKDASYIGEVEIIRGAAPAMAQGVVFDDINRNSTRDPGEPGIAGVQVSNGREVVLTGTEGGYALPARDDMNLFITKPAGYAVPVSEEMVPQFSYRHKPAGSPPLRFGGIAPTGLLPQAVNFPLIADDVGAQFDCLIFGDAQTYSNREIGYLRDTAGRMLAARDSSSTECLIFAGDMMGDDLSLFPRFKRVIALGGVPQYFVAGNHDLDFDAASDGDSFDTFRREWGPEYYSSDIGQVHFVVLDNVRYPCNGIDPHDFCASGGSPNYNGVIHQRQMTWLRNDLAHVPLEKLIVIAAHIPFVTFTDPHARKHQTDNLAELYEMLEGRKVLGLSGHTHTTEQILPGEHFEGWHAATGTGPAQFHQIITGAVSGSWWAGDLGAQGVPHATQRLGSPRGYYRIAFDGAEYVDTFLTFDAPEARQMHVSFNTKRFRDWAEQLFAFTRSQERSSDAIPPVTVSDLGDPGLLTRQDLAEDTWVAVNVWNGSRDSMVEVAIGDRPAILARRTQEGEGEAARQGPAYADPHALAKQATQGRMAFRSTEGGEETAGFQTWTGFVWQGPPGPFQDWMLTRKSSHLWRARLPADLPLGPHKLTVTTTDRYGRIYTEVIGFEVVETLPQADWRFEAPL
ncbi:MAG: calcineurin-like phosphoesterase C-terminal domain-containing protein [Pseudomonadota bacterium]